MQEPLINIGSQLSGETVAEDLVSILDSTADAALRLKALDVYGSITKIENVTITNCYLSGDKVVNIDKDFNVKENK